MITEILLMLILFKMHFNMILLLIFEMFLSLLLVHSIERDPVDGEFTSNLRSYEFIVPHKVNAEGEFLTFSLPNYFKHDYSSRRRRRDDCDPDVINYKLHFNGKDHHIQLWPNHGFISPETIAEFHYPGSDVTVVARKLRRMNPALCHYTGTIRGIDGSKVALSLCEGLTGYLKTADGVYYVEPVKEFCANEQGHHLHVIYTPDHKIQRKSVKDGLHGSEETHLLKNPIQTNCGTDDEDWEMGWRRAFNEHFRINHHQPNNFDEHFITRRDNHPELQHHYLEVLVVVDKAFLDFHKDKDHENYILTVMNMVSDYFHDSSTGIQLDVVVVRIIYLNQHIAALDVSANPDAEHTLKSFCKWQNEINPKDHQHPQHHDIAVLITRHDICLDENKNCDLLGMAHMASACVPSDACSINEDKGLLLGVVIAHELGHIMGCDHDCDWQSANGNSKNSGCIAKSSDGFNHIMAPIISLATTSWSACSRTYLKELLNNQLGTCLSDEPVDSPYKFNEMLPGVVYDADYQCSLIFTNSTHCPVEEEVFCQKLFCTTGSTKCLSNGEPPADGTKCGARKWCFKGKCSDIGTRSNAVAGGWTRWSDYGECSRTCGGGIQVSTRTCSNPQPKNGGIHCAGEDKRYKICNTKPCSIGSASFRSQQCAEYNKVPRNGKFHQWTPYFPNGADSPTMCILYCINEEHVFTKLSPRVKDGTPCRIGTMDVCVAGQCRKVGCDWELDSDAVSDKCGVCNGDNSGCKHITGSFTTGGTGYLKVAKLPKGARNVVIRENASSENTIAISNKKGKYFLNGGNREESDGEKVLGKNVAVYLHPEPDQEKLYIIGPLHQCLIFYVVFYEPKNVGFTYDYYIRDKNFHENPVISAKEVRNRDDNDDEDNSGNSKKGKTKYRWDFVEWSKCSVRCGGGQSISKPVCVNTQCYGGIVRPELCKKCEKPQPKIRICNRRECMAKWHVGEWGACSGCKHQPGFQLRHVWCATESSHWEEPDSIISNDRCFEEDGSKPKCKQLCMGECPPSCARLIRGVSETLDPLMGNYDQNFYLKYFGRIDMIRLEPEGVMFGLARNWQRKGSNNPYLSPGAKQCQQTAAECKTTAKPKCPASRMKAKLTVHKTTTTPCPTTTTECSTTTECPETEYSSTCGCKPGSLPFEIPSAMSYPEITIPMPLLPPPLFRRTISITASSEPRGVPVLLSKVQECSQSSEENKNNAIFSKKVKKSDDPLSREMKRRIFHGLKENLLSEMDEVSSGKLRDNNEHPQQLRATRQWRQFGRPASRHPSALLLLQEPNRQDAFYGPRKFRRHFRQNRDTKDIRPVHEIVSDRIPGKKLAVNEASYQECPMNLSDTVFQTVGDGVVGSLDLEHSKILSKAESVAVMNLKKNRSRC